MRPLKLKELWKSLDGQGYGSIKCYICQTESFAKEDPNDKSTKVICPRCGYFKITYHLREDYKSSGYKLLEKEVSYLVSSYLRRRQEEISKETIEEPILIALGDFDFIKEEAIKSKPSFSNKIFLLLEAIESLQSFFGEEIIIEDLWIENYLLAMSYLKGDNELEYCINSLRELGYIKSPNPWTQKYKNYPPLRISPKGYEFLEKYRKEKDFLKSKDVFVAIEFKEEFDDIYEAIEEAIEKEAGYKAHKANKDHYSDYIMDWIKTKIKESRFVVAEISTGNLGVYFEIGYALGRGIPVITILKQESEKEDPFEKVHFDLKQFNTIVYKTPEELKERLYYRIASLFGTLKKGTIIKDEQTQKTHRSGAAA